MANYIFVHGGNVKSDTWNTLVKRLDYPPKQKLGGMIWDSIAAELRAHGHQVYAPTLLDEYQHDLSDHIKQIIRLITKHRLQEVILVGHSYGGMIITGIAAQLAEKIRHLVYIDAALPKTGQSLFDLLKLAGLSPETVVDGAPQAYLERLVFEKSKISSILKTYIFCTQSEFTLVTDLARQQINSESSLWHSFNLETSHLPQATMPKQLTHILLDLDEQKNEYT